ncbi:MAG: putative GTP-binding protein EngB [Gammaproteobacteria bacterium]|nr:putative GTP-binding protein EngB [Gammaproteobacteria bacterium]
MPLKTEEKPENLLNRARFTIAAADPAQWPAAPGAEVAFAGRSNVGKSSAINVVTQRRGLARTSKTPGRTRQIVFFDLGGGGSRLVDLPGYGYAKVPDELRASWARLIERYLTERKALKGLILLMDARHPLTELDRRMLEWCEPRRLPIHVLLTKSDKLGHNQARQGEFAVRRFVTASQDIITVQRFSALKRVGVAEAQQRIRDWLAGNGNC